jgi:hypothetical protein
MAGAVRAVARNVTAMIVGSTALLGSVFISDNIELKP